MNLHFQSPEAKDAHILAPYYVLRPNRTCDTGLLDTFIWKEYYHVQYCIADERAVLLLMRNEKEYFTALPYCSEKDLPEFFRLIRRYFNEVLDAPLKIYLADEEGIHLLGLDASQDYLVQEQEDLKDYLYDAEELRTLPGKRFHQKRNLISKFNRSLEGRWEYQTITCAQRDEVMSFLDFWYQQKEEGDAGLNFERSGIEEIIGECCLLDYRAGGIWIDGRLSALSIGTWNPLEEMAVISVEKADATVPGLYQVINQEFLLHEFPEARLVNREDDVGIPGLRQAKMSYHPVGFARKFMILQKNHRGSQKELSDYYEEAVHASAGDNA